MINFEFEKVDTVDSTNDYLQRELDNNLITKDKILIAREQTNGHGKDEKSFLSIKDKGIYFTFLHLYDELSDLDDITLIAGVSVYKVFKDIFDISLRIKGINDLIYNDKKICGILCKNIISKKAVLIGIGIDIFHNENLPIELRDIVGFLFKDKYELVDILKSNNKINHESCVYKNVYDDFKYLKLDGIEIQDENLWEADHLVIQIVMNIYMMLKDRKLYENLYMECKRA